MSQPSRAGGGPVGRGPVRMTGENTFLELLTHSDGCPFKTATGQPGTAELPINNTAINPSPQMLIRFQSSSAAQIIL